MTVLLGYLIGPKRMQFPPDILKGIVTGNNLQSVNVFVLCHFKHLTFNIEAICP